MSDWPQDPTMLKKRLANFRPDKFSAMATAQKWRKDRARDKRPGMSPEHLALVRQLPCTCCYLDRHTECHHLKSGPAFKERGIGLKATDRWVLPLCGPYGHHHELEQFGSRREFDWFWSNFGINPHALANALWHASGDLTRLNRVLLAHKLAGSKELLDRKK